MAGSSAETSVEQINKIYYHLVLVHWLINNFEPAEGCSLRRSTLYNYYLLHCTEQRIEPVNPASFGKLIRSVFLGLRTRRLGTRGNSKYHYYGIRVKMNSPLNNVAEENAMAIRNHPMSLSPTGSPQSHQPQSPSTLLTQVNNNSSSSSNGPTPKRGKTSHSSSSSASTGSSANSGSYTANNSYEGVNQNVNTLISQNATEYKPILTAVTGGGAISCTENTLILNQAPQHIIQQQQATPLTTVVLSNGSNKPAILNSQPAAITKIVKNDTANNKLANHHINQSPQPQPQVLTQLHNQPANVNVGLLQTNASANDLNKHDNNKHHNENQLVQVAVPQPQPQQQQVQQQVVPPQQDDNQIPTIQMPDFGSINTDNIQLPSDCTLNDVKKFEELYKKHCEKILDLVVALKLDSIKNLWSVFWRSPDAKSDPMAAYYEEQLAGGKFFNLCQVDGVFDFVKQCDFQFYQFCIEILIPDVFGLLPHNLVTLIRNLSKSIETWLRNALTNVPERMKQMKILIIKAFSMTLRRYTSLSHLIQTVKNSLQNEGLLIHMSQDINKVDFNYIKEQLKWTCGCDESIVSQFENDFKDSLKNHESKPMESWLSWIDTLATTYMNQNERADSPYDKTAKHFLLTWSFLCSTTVRDLTLRSAPTFGSFHLVRLLYDEYMNYLIEHKISNKYQKTPLEVMCQEINPVL